MIDNNDDNLEFDFDEEEEAQPPEIRSHDGLSTADLPGPEIGDGEIPLLESEDIGEIVAEAIVRETEPPPKVIVPQRPIWAVVVLTIWIIAFYCAFYYFLIGHRFEKFAIGG